MEYNKLFTFRICYDVMGDDFDIIYSFEIYSLDGSGMYLVICKENNQILGFSSLAAVYDYLRGLCHSCTKSLSIRVMRRYRDYTWLNFLSYTAKMDTIFDMTIKEVVEKYINNL